jgi:uncharacterized protein YrrD
MRLKDVRGLPVIDPTAARKVGTVSDYQIDPVSGRIAALDITPMDSADDERILAQRIRRIGSSAVILTARGGSMAGTPVEVNDRWLDTSTSVGLEVMGDDGNRIGHLVDATFDQESLIIDAYVLRASFFERLLGRRGRIQPDKVHACSRELMIVSSGRVKAAEVAPEATPQTTPLELRMPLKDEDRLPEYEPVPDGQPVGASQR